MLRTAKSEWCTRHNTTIMQDARANWQARRVRNARLTLLRGEVFHTEGVAENCGVGWRVWMGLMVGVGVCGRGL